MRYMLIRDDNDQIIDCQPLKAGEGNPDITLGYTDLLALTEAGLPGGPDPEDDTEPDFQAEAEALEPA